MKFIVTRGTSKDSGKKSKKLYRKTEEIRVEKIHDCIADFRAFIGNLMVEKPERIQSNRIR